MADENDQEAGASGESENLSAIMEETAKLQAEMATRHEQENAARDQVLAAHEAARKAHAEMMSKPFPPGLATGFPPGRHGGREPEEKPEVFKRSWFERPQPFGMEADEFAQECAAALREGRDIRHPVGSNQELQQRLTKTLREGKLVAWDRDTESSRLGGQYPAVIPVRTCTVEPVDLESHKAKKKGFKKSTAFRLKRKPLSQVWGD